MPYDPSRRKEVAATPEEAVRQAVVRWLLESRRVPVHLLETEFALGQLQRGHSGRVDVLVHAFRDDGDVRHPWLLVECKRPGESDWAALQVQVNKYLKVLRPRHVLLALGQDWRVLSLDAQGNYQPQAALPLYPG